MRPMVRTLDRLLRRRLGLFKYWDDPRCLFRVRVLETSRSLHVSEGEIPAGATVLELHLWNEHIPPMPADAPCISAAVKLRRRLAASTRELACRMRRDPRLRGVQAVGGVTPLFSSGDGSAMEKVFLRLGFATRPYRNPMGRPAEFWEEVYGWMIMLAYYRGSQRSRPLSRIRRTDFWMSAEQFFRRYDLEGAAGAIRLEVSRMSSSKMRE
jgi:hypothetical protein